MIDTQFLRYWHLLATYLRPQRFQVVLLALTLFGAIGMQVLIPLLTGRFIDAATSGVALHDLTFLALSTIVAAIVGQVLGVAETYIAEQISWTATNALRTDLLSSLLQLDAAFHSAHTSGELIERVDGDVATLARFFSQFVVSVIGNGILLIGIVALLYYVDWRIGLAISFFVIVALLVMLRIRALASPSWLAERQLNADFYGFLGEYLAGLQDIRSSGAEAFVLRRCAEIMRSWLAVTRRAQMWGYGLSATSVGMFGLGTVVALALSAILFHVGVLTVGAVYLVFQGTQMLSQPTDQIREEVQNFQQAGASITRIQALLSIKPKVVDGVGNILPSGAFEVTFDDVTFGYNEDIPVLRHVSFSLAPGRVLGVVGHTGSGKTTLTRLLLRFYDPQAGCVCLNGVDLRTVRLEAIRTRIGLVTQEVQLFHASLRENLTLFDADIPDERILTALHDLGLTSWLNGLPDGLNTQLLTENVGLSAGQAQIVACARVLLQQPDLVILDEPSSRLDPAMDRLVHRAFERLLVGRTGIIVAHRLTTLANADDILVLEYGEIREHGVRSALIADATSRFSKLVQAESVEVTL